MLNLRSARLAAVAGVAALTLAFGANAASAALITALERGGSVIDPVIGSPIGVDYFSNDGTEELPATYGFHYTPPPTLIAASATTNNVFNTIPNFNLSWYYSLLDVGSSAATLGTAIFTNHPQGLGATENLPFSFGTGFYYVVLTGDNSELGHNYTLDVKVTSIRNQETPLPAALPLFASAVGGGFLFRRLRRKRAASA